MSDSSSNPPKGRGILFTGDDELDRTPILELAARPRSKRNRVGPVCGCPSTASNQLGGCQPKLMQLGSDQFKAICATCLKPLHKGIHRRRDQTHVLGLADLPMERLDVDDLRDAGLLLDLVEVATRAGGDSVP